MTYQGGTHKPTRHIERRFIAAGARRAAAFAPGTRVLVRATPGVPNPYADRMGEIVESMEADGETLYRVLLDYPLPGEQPGQPVEIFADELTRTHLPKSDVSVSLAPRPNRRLHPL